MNRNPMSFPPNTPTVAEDNREGRGEFCVLPRISQEEVPQEIMAPQPRSHNTNPYGWEHGKSLLSPPYSLSKLEPNTETSFRLVDLMTMGQCTKYELMSVMRYYLSLMGYQSVEDNTFWGLASFF